MNLAEQGRAAGTPASRRVWYMAGIRMVTVLESKAPLKYVTLCHMASVYGDAVVNPMPSCPCWLCPVQ